MLSERGVNPFKFQIGPFAIVKRGYSTIGKIHGYRRFLGRLWIKHEEKLRR